jgi:hypothetical protein
MQSAPAFPGFLVFIPIAAIPVALVHELGHLVAVNAIASPTISAT